MKQIVERLVKDMRWRLSAAGKRFRPSRQECNGWGSQPIPPAATFFGGCAAQTVCFGLMLSAFAAELFPAALALMLLMFAALPLAIFASGRLQRRADLRRYSELVQHNERFALIEYSKLLQRQIHTARADAALGGTQELARLSELQARIDQLIRDGAGLAKRAAGGGSTLSDEASLAESVLEAYSIGSNDELATLDARLPAALRSRLDELDAAAGELPAHEREHG